MAITFDVLHLYNDLDVLRQHKDLTWRGLAVEAGVSPSTVSRMGKGAKPDADSMARLLSWSGLTFARYVETTPED